MDSIVLKLNVQAVECRELTSTEGTLSSHKVSNPVSHPVSGHQPQTPSTPLIYILTSPPSFEPPISRNKTASCSNAHYKKPHAKNFFLKRLLGLGNPFYRKVLLQKRGGLTTTSTLVPIFKQKQAKSVSGCRRPELYQGELKNLLEILQENFIPGYFERETVCKLQEARYNIQKRNCDSLRSDLSDLYRTSAPTGNNTIPRDLLRENIIRKLMKDSADLGDGA